MAPAGLHPPAAASVGNCKFFGIMVSTIQQINGIRKYFVENKMFSELRGFNAGVRMFSRRRRDREEREIGASTAPINTRNPRIIAAKREMIYKPSKFQVYEKIKDGDKKWLNTCRLAYPDAYDQGYEFYALQNASKLI